MKQSVLLQAGFNSPIKETIKSIKNVGFDSVFVTLNSSISDDEIEKIVNSGLSIETLHLPYNNPYKLINSLWLNKEETYHAIDIIKNGIVTAHKFNIPTVILHASSSYAPPKLNEQGLDHFKIIADFCEENNVFLAIENIKRLDYVEYLLNNMSNKNVGFCFDVGHANAFTKNLTTYDWSHLLSRLHCVHLHDNNGEQDQHLIPGMGNIDWSSILRSLLTAKPDLTLTWELYYKDREQFYPKNISELEFYKIAKEASDAVLKKGGFIL